MPVETAKNIDINYRVDDAYNKLYVYSKEQGCYLFATTILSDETPQQAIRRYEAWESEFDDTDPMDDDYSETD